MDDHKKIHNKNLIYFSPKKGQVFVDKNGKREYFDVYCDLFRTPLKEKDSAVDVDPFIRINAKFNKAV